MFQKRRTGNRKRIKTKIKIKGSVCGIIAGTFLVVLSGIFLPGILIERQERKEVGGVQAVPAQYIASDSQ